MERKTEFIYASLLDLQSTIRSVDVRVGFLFLVLFAPLAVGDKVASAVATLAKAECWLVGAVIGCALVWSLALVFVFLTASAVADPGAHVPGERPEGRFYSGDLFRVGAFELLWPGQVMSARTVAQELDGLPESEDQVHAELVFEKLKLTYIRDLKLARFKVSLAFTGLWIAAGVLVFALAELP